MSFKTSLEPFYVALGVDEGTGKWPLRYDYPKDARLATAGYTREVGVRQTDSMTLFLDGETVRITGVSPSVTLLEYLRNTARTATKEGCAEGDCGACTVAVRGEDGAYRAVNSCLVPLGAVSNQEVVTAAGLADGGELHPVQALLAAAGGSQGGFCTPGCGMSLFAAQGSGERGDAVLEGNLCRCTGYGPIRAALHSLPDADPDGPLNAPSKASAPTSYSADEEQFFHPQTLKETFEVLETYPDAKLVAGGTDLGVELNKLLERPAVMVSLAGVGELRVLRETEAGLELGAALTLSELEVQLQDRVPLLETMLKQFAARQIRNRATLGGGLATASPVGDLAPVLLAYDAHVTLVSASGERTVPLSEFFTGYRRNVLAAGELVKSVMVPVQEPNCVEAVYKVGKRGADDISTVAAAFLLGLEHGLVTSARLAYGGVAATPTRAFEVEQFLVGQPWTARTASEAAARLKTAFTPLSDLRGSAAYRRVLVGNLFEKFFYEYGTAEVAA